VTGATNSGTLTAVSGNTCTADATSSAGWSNGQWAYSGTYCVVCPTGGTGGTKTVARITGNTAGAMTLNVISAGNGWTNGQPATGSTYQIYPILTPDGVHMAPHAHALCAAMALAQLPAFVMPQQVFTINDLPARGPVTAGRARN
jgi:hypothetical protein